MSLIRAQRRMQAPARPAVQADMATPTGISNALGVVKGAAQDVQAQELARRSEAEKQIAERERKRQMADDATALIEYENQVRLGIAEAEQRVRQTVGASGDNFFNAMKEERAQVYAKAKSALPSFVSDDGRLSIDDLARKIEGQSSVAALQFEESTRTAWVVDTLQQSVEQDAAAVIADPMSRDRVLNAALTRLAAQSGRLDPETERKMRDGIERDIAVAQVTGLARGGNFLAASDAAAAFAPRLSVDDQLSLSAKITQEVNAYESRLEQERIERSDQASIDLAVKFVQGGLTREDILTAAPALESGTEVRSWFTAMDTANRRNEERIKDIQEETRAAFTPQMVDNVAGQFARGEINKSEAIDAVVTLYSGGFVDKQGIGDVLRRIEQTQDNRYTSYQGIVEAPFRQGGLFADFDEGKELGRALAIAEFSQRWPEIKELSDAQIRKEIEGINERAGKEMRASLPALPLGMYFVGEPQSAQELEKAEAMLTEDMLQDQSANTLDSEAMDRYAREQVRIDAWRRRIGGE